MKANHLSLARTAGLVAGSLLAASVALTARAAEADAFPEFENFIKFSGQLSNTTGSDAAYQRSQQKESAGSLGIEEFLLTKDLNDTTSLKLEGRALSGAEDYLAAFKLTKSEVGSADASFKSFRTFYDGAGGFFPINKAFMPLYPRERYVDRGRFTVGFTTAIPKAPVFTVRYTQETRTGKKDSTIWGDTDLTGIPISSSSSLNPISANRKILPAYIDLDEKQETLELSASQTFANTTVSLTFLGTSIDNDDVRSIDRYFGELKPYPAIPSSPARWIAPTQANNQNKGYDRQIFKEDGRTFIGKVETVINPQVTAFAEGLIRHTSSDIQADRMISASIATVGGVQTTVGAFSSGVRPPTSYASAGHFTTDSYTGVIGVDTKFLPDLGIKFAVRLEQFDVAGYNSVSYTNYLIPPATGTVTLVPVSGVNGVRISEKPVSPEINARYSGFKTVALYADWDYRSSPSDERTNYAGETLSGAAMVPSVARSSLNIKEKHSNLKIGANWTPCTFFNARAELFTKDHENNFNGYDVSAGSYYRLNYDITGARLSATVKPLAQVSFTTRFVEQIGKAKTIGDNFASTDSGDSKLYQLSESVNWTPNKAVYVQANATLVYDTTSTSYPIVTGTAKNVVHDSNSNYWNGSFITGFVVSKDTDLQVQGTYYKADNFNPDLSGSTLAYGASTREYSITVGVKQKLSDRLIANAKLGYIDSVNETMGGNGDFKGPVGYVSLDYKL